MTSEKLKNQEKIIKPILEEMPETRGDDFLLYAEVIERYRPELREMPVKAFFEEHRNLYCPSYESVSRVRRRLQNKYPELVSDEVKEKREKQEKEYKKYLRGV